MPGEVTGWHGFPGIPEFPGAFCPLLFPRVLPGLFDEELVLGFGLGACELEFPLVAPGVPGRVEHGEPPGELPGALCLFGAMVEGCVLLPGVGDSGVFWPGTLAPEGPLGEAEPEGVWFCCVAGGVAVPAGGVAEVAGGIAVLPCGVAVEAGGVAGAAGGVAGAGGGVAAAGGGVAELGGGAERPA